MYAHVRVAYLKAAGESRNLEQSALILFTLGKDTHTTSDLG